MKTFFQYLFICILLWAGIEEFFGEGVKVINLINLMFHEAGHMIFLFLGQFIGVLGGTLGQLLIPLIFMGYFIRQGEYFSASVLFWWFGQNFIGIGAYIADARTQVLPLIGGEHDWAYLLGEMNLLHKDVYLGGLVQNIGGGIMLTALILALLSLESKGLPKKKEDTDQDPGGWESFGPGRKDTKYPDTLYESLDREKEAKVQDKQEEA